jgi:hypothetical protein
MRAEFGAYGLTRHLAMQLILAEQRGVRLDHASPEHGAGAATEKDRPRCQMLSPRRRDGLPGIYTSRKSIASVSWVGVPMSLTRLPPRH